MLLDEFSTGDINHLFNLKRVNIENELIYFIKEELLESYMDNFSKNIKHTDFTTVLKILAFYSQYDYVSSILFESTTTEEFSQQLPNILSWFAENEGTLTRQDNSELYCAPPQRGVTSGELLTKFFQAEKPINNLHLPDEMDDTEAKDESFGTEYAP